LLEHRSASLSTGYFARLDYVSFIAMEFGFASTRSRSLESSTLVNLLAGNMLSNHILNLACTVADAGAVGTILWSFEMREVVSQQTESATGSRLHVHLATSEYASPSTAENIPDFANSVSELLLLVATATRVSRSRLVHNLLVTADDVEGRAATGPLASSCGFDDGESSSSGLLPVSILGGSTSCSLTRHILRIRHMLQWQRYSQVSPS
jgi:NADH:ubiquinone oxidoreductase subunit D